MNGLRSLFVLAVAAITVWVAPAHAGVTTFTDVSPDFSDTDPSDPDGATGGRVNQLGIHPTDNQTIYAASEWGGLYKTTDGGLEWFRLDAHLPVATWDVEVDPSTPSRVYATSFFDGRATTTAGINVSTDSGATWNRPATATPPVGFCSNAADRTEASAYGIAVDPSDSSAVWIGTNCGAARSTDSGASWSFVDPTGPAGSADRIWDTLVSGGTVHVCGNDGHLASTDGGASWAAGSGLPSGRCSLAASPDESYVLFAVSGTSIHESVDGGANWTQTRSNPTPQGRIPFVATNQRSDDGGDDVFDLWFGDVSLFRVQCTTPASPAPGGSPRCGTGNSPAWNGGYTRSVGGHDDTGDIVFDPEAADDACPVLFSSDGGVYYNTDTTADCHAPNWEQPNVTPHGLWLFTMSGADIGGGAEEDLYFGNQDNGVFASTDVSSADPTWHNEICCDGFDTAADPQGAMYDVCCFGGGGRATRAFKGGRGFSSVTEINYPPTGLLDGFNFPDNFANFGGRRSVMLAENCTVGGGGCPGTGGGVYITENLGAFPITWVELGAATEPPVAILCGVYPSVANDGTPTFYVQTGNCNGTGTTDQLYKYTGTDPNGSWTQLMLPAGGFGVVGVHPGNPDRLMAAGFTASDASMYSSTDGGSSWDPMPALDALMDGAGAFPIKNSRGPTNFTGFNGYWQPSLIGFDGSSPLVVAGGQDSGVFLSNDDGETWELLTDPFTSDISGIPHIPRPRYAYFDDEGGLYVGSQGRGIWRIGVGNVFADGFESGDTSAWSVTVD